jgi:hypothetical protein
MKYSQPYGIVGSMQFWSKFYASTPEEQKTMLFSPEFMSLYQAQMIGFQYFCFNCYMLCPVNN